MLGFLLTIIIVISLVGAFMAFVGLQQFDSSVESEETEVIEEAVQEDIAPEEDELVEEEGVSEDEILLE